MAVASGGDCSAASSRCCFSSLALLMAVTRRQYMYYFEGLCSSVKSMYGPVYTERPRLKSTNKIYSSPLTLFMAAASGRVAAL